MSEYGYDPVPETVTDALERWDKGESVFSVEMGGLGPGHEMAIQGLAFELMRAMNGFADWEDDKKKRELIESLDPIISECNKKPWGGFSGAQVGVAKVLAARVCKAGYRNALRDPALDEHRLIQVCKLDLRQ